MFKKTREGISTKKIIKRREGIKKETITTLNDLPNQSFEFTEI
jgi:hypothetical protein